MNQNPIDMLLDENNTDPIVLYNENNEEVQFEQIALVPIDGKIYAILKPIGEFAGVGEDEALVFTITEYEDEDVLVIVDDDATIDAVFNEYYALLEEANN